jgi:hypothetical protein
VAAIDNNHSPEAESKPAYAEQDEPGSAWIVDLAKCLSNSGIAEPVRGIAQIIDHKCGTNLDKYAKSVFAAAGIEAPKPAPFGTSNWYAQQLGDAAGMMLWVMGARRLLFGKAFGEPARQQATARLFSRETHKLAAKEASLSGASGMIYGAVLHSSDEANVGKDGFWSDRSHSGLNYGQTFAAIGAVNTYAIAGLGIAASAIERPLSATMLGRSLRLPSSLDTGIVPAVQKSTAFMLRTPVVAGALSGIPGGLVTAEAAALHDRRWIATGEEFKESIVANMFVGTTFATAHWLTAPKTAGAAEGHPPASGIEEKVATTGTQSEPAAAEFQPVKKQSEPATLTPAEPADISEALAHEQIERNGYALDSSGF